MDDHYTTLWRPHVHHRCGPISRRLVMTIHLVAQRYPDLLPLELWWTVLKFAAVANSSLDLPWIVGERIRPAYPAVFESEAKISLPYAHDDTYTVHLSSRDPIYRFLEHNAQRFTDCDKVGIFIVVRVKIIEVEDWWANMQPRESLHIVLTVVYGSCADNCVYGTLVARHNTQHMVCPFSAHIWSLFD